MLRLFAVWAPAREVAGEDSEEEGRDGGISFPSQEARTEAGNTSSRDTRTAERTCWEIN